MSRQKPNVALIGLGEVGSTLVRNLGSRVAAIRAYDPLFDDVDSPPSQSLIDLGDVTACGSAAEAANGCQLIISAVTAARALAAAESATDGIAGDAWFLDLNSIAPETSQRAASTISDAGGRYIECAVMSPINPQGVASPMLLGGPNAQAFKPLAARLGFANATVFSSMIGPASAAKLCRSVMVKGMEALVTESMLAATHYGVEQVVLDSLGKMFPGVDWNDHATYLIERTRTHGVRRAEEMHEAANTVRSAGVEPIMSDACARRQALSADVSEFGAADALSRLLTCLAERRDS